MLYESVGHVAERKIAGFDLGEEALGAWTLLIAMLLDANHDEGHWSMHR